MDPATIPFLKQMYLPFGNEIVNHFILSCIRSDTLYMVKTSVVRVTYISANSYRFIMHYLLLSENATLFILSVLSNLFDFLAVLQYERFSLHFLLITSVFNNNFSAAARTGSSAFDNFGT